MWKIAGALWKSFLNLILQNANKIISSDNHVSGGKPTGHISYIGYSITIPLGRFPKIVIGCKLIKVFFVYLLAFFCLFCFFWFFFPL